MPIAGRRGKGRVVAAELFWCPVGEYRMRSHAIVIVAPRGEYRAGLGERREARLIQALVAQPAVEALDERVLLRLAGLDVVPVDAGSLAPGQSGSHCRASSLRTASSASCRRRVFQHDAFSSSSDSAAWRGGDLAEDGHELGSVTPPLADAELLCGYALEGRVGGDEFFSGEDLVEELREEGRLWRTTQFRSQSPSRVLRFQRVLTGLPPSTA